MDPVIITAAISGSITTRDAKPNLPITVEENVHEAVQAATAGAAMIHIHAREEDGEPTQRLERFRPIIDRIRKEGCQAILCLSTGSAGGRASGAARYENLELRPEVASFDCGSINLGERVFENSLPFLRELARKFLESDAKPEIECFDVGHIVTALQLRDEGLLSEPLHFQFVLGVRGGAPATIEQVIYMRSLIPVDATWSLCAVGRGQLPLNILALIAGGHVRTGLEDNVYYHRGVLAESNAQLVARIVRVAEEIGRPVATAAEAREILGLPR